MLRLMLPFLLTLFFAQTIFAQIAGKYLPANKAFADSLKGQTKYLRIEAIKYVGDVLARSDVTFVDSSGAIYYRIGDDLLGKAPRWNTADDFVEEMRRARRKGSVVRWPAGTKTTIHKVGLGEKSVDIGITNLNANKTEIHLQFERFAYRVGDIKKLLAIVFADRETDLQPTAIKLEIGMAIDDVIKLKGQPKTRADLGAKTVFTYEDVKIIFQDGKLADVQ